MNWETADYLKVVVEYNVCNKDVIPPCEPLCFLSFLPPPPPCLPPPSSPLKLLRLGLHISYCQFMFTNTVWADN